MTRKADMMRTENELRDVAGQDGIYRGMAMRLVAKAENGPASQKLLKEMRDTIRDSRGADNLTVREVAAVTENANVLERIRLKALDDEAEKAENLKSLAIRARASASKEALEARVRKSEAELWRNSDFPKELANCSNIFPEYFEGIQTFSSDI